MLKCPNCAKLSADLDRQVWRAQWMRGFLGAVLLRLKELEARLG